MGVCRADAEESGAGDQGMMFVYACRETDSLISLPIELAHALTKRLSYVREACIIPELLPDGKAQVTVQYEDGEPRRIDMVVVSTQHMDSISENELRTAIIDEVISKALLNEQTHLPLAENSANTVPTMMRFASAYFMPRAKGDRPDVVPEGAVNFAFLGQFAEQPRDTVSPPNTRCARPWSRFTRCSMWIAACRRFGAACMTSGIC